MRRLKKLSRKQQFWLIGIALALILLLWLIQAPSGFPKNKEIEIREGAGLAEITRELSERKVIKTPLLFNLLVRLSGGSSKIKAGDYWFESKLNSWSIARRLISGQYVQNPVKVTIPEGSSPVQISRILMSKFPKLDQKKLLALLSAKPAENLPDTYFLPPELTAEKMVENLQRNFRRQTAGLFSEALIFGRGWEDVLIMASLVEEEANDYATRQMIAGILWKRLDIKMPLQVDVARVTYEKRGLPERAIVAPGLKAIKATIHPTKSDYLYYLADRTGVTHYAVDFAGHKANKVKYLR